MQIDLPINIIKQYSILSVLDSSWLSVSSKLLFFLCGVKIT